MSKSIKAKLNNHGAGILYALLVLLVVAAISSVIITGAMVNTSRTENRVEDEQLYLAAESVADILSHDWHGNLGCAYVLNDSDWVMYWATEGDKETEDNKEKKTVPYAEYFQQFSEAVLEGKNSPFPKTFPVSISSTVKTQDGKDGTNSNFNGIAISAQLVSPNYSTGSGEKAGGFPEPSFLTVKCIITAEYTDPSINVEPYQIIITLTAEPQSMYNNTVAYNNWIINDISQYRPDKTES